MTSAALAGVLSQREPILAWFRDLNIPSTSGPFNATAGYAAILGSLGQATIVSAWGFADDRWPADAAVGRLGRLDRDDGRPGGRQRPLIFAVPQAVLETKPEVLKIIETAERPGRRRDRIASIACQHGARWSGQDAVEEPAFEFVSWSHDTLDPSMESTWASSTPRQWGPPSLTTSIGTSKDFTGGSTTRKSPCPGIELGDDVVYYPRRAYDMWNTRYFILPADSGDWRDPMRGTASFLFQSRTCLSRARPIHRATRSGGIGRNGPNLRFYRASKPADIPAVLGRSHERGTFPHARLTRETHRSVMREILYAADPIWKDATQLSYDPHSVAWVSRDDLRELRPVLSGEKPISSETVKVTYPNPQQVVLEATLESPGLVILADVYYPGWELLIDGKPAPIYRVNVMMRGAAVSSGRHRLVYTYRPQSFRVGRLVSLAGLAALLIFGVVWRDGPLIRSSGDTGRAADPLGSGLLASQLFLCGSIEVYHASRFCVDPCPGLLRRAVLICYAPALFRDRQFGFRDAAHYYYPLNERVQNEWNHGRWPLWEPEENAGVPLLGNPTAAVLYPGKLVFAILPYPWAARIYIVAHSALAFLTMVVLMRSWGTSGLGSAMSGLAYAFGAPILFQYCNIIYLIGAAWLPLGIHAADRWVRLGQRWGLWELAIVVSMQILGGEPQAAYLLGLASIGYASGLAWARTRSRTGTPAVAKPRRPRFGLSLAWRPSRWWCGSLRPLRWPSGCRGCANPACRLRRCAGCPGYRWE